MVEKSFCVRRLQPRQGFVERDGDVVHWVIFEEMTTVHFGASLENYEFESGTEVVHCGDGASEHRFSVCVFLG